MRRRLFAIFAAFGLIFFTGCSCDSDNPGSNNNDNNNNSEKCGDTVCIEGQVCLESACVADLGACENSDQCQGDSFCEPTLKRCVPFPDDKSDPSCKQLSIPGIFTPTVQCEFTAAPAGDPFPQNVHVLSTPLVVDFMIGRTAADPHQPSIVAVFDDGIDGNDVPNNTGVIRILDGKTCTQQAELGSIRKVAHSAVPAIGDIDGTGMPEIVAFTINDAQTEYGVVAFEYSVVLSQWQQRWATALPAGMKYGGWAGPSLHDLDNDGKSEIVVGDVVINSDGTVLNATAEANPSLPSARVQGYFSVVANVDSDDAAELVQAGHVYEWDAAQTKWIEETWSPKSNLLGHVAIADFGDFPGTQGWPSSTPEVVVILEGSPKEGMARVQTLDGTVILNDVPIPKTLTNPRPPIPSNAGGPPTIADFDGDGRPEFATAGGERYVVFDLDCIPGLAVGTCATNSTDGVLWSQPSQDLSSNVTGSSVFDFEGDGKAEAVYGDECFVRVYDGRSGEVVFSQSRSSCTWYENPVIADVDGDFNAEIVIGNNFNCGPTPTQPVACQNLDAGDLDPLFKGLRCKENADCASNSCVEGLCRCTTHNECCSGSGCANSGFVCADAPTGTPGTGKTCRSAHVGVNGIRVYSDAMDRWVRSRMIWNQHAYAVTNVGDWGEIPKRNDVARNWLQLSASGPYGVLNNFRQNVQGGPNAEGTPDMTTRALPAVCDETTITLATKVCNRGAEALAAGLSVGFYYGTTITPENKACGALTKGVINPGGCEEVSCQAPLAQAAETKITIVGDDTNEVRECRDGNNTATVTFTCGTTTTR